MKDFCISLYIKEQDYYDIFSLIVMQVILLIK